jgi:hypothetical protein
LRCSHSVTGTLSGIVKPNVSVEASPTAGQDPGRWYVVHFQPRLGVHSRWSRLASNVSRHNHPLIVLKLLKSLIRSPKAEAEDDAQAVVVPPCISAFRALNPSIFPLH